MKTTTNILKTLTLIIVAILVGVSTTYALGTLQPSSAPADTQYSLNDLYTLVTTGATTTEDTGDITIPGSISSSFHTITELYTALTSEISNITPETLALGTTAFGVEGTLGEGTNIDINSSGLFTDNGDGTFTDENTTLIWKSEDHSSLLNWTDSLAYCAGLDFANSTDWRLPSVKEFMTITDYDNYITEEEITIFTDLPNIDSDGGRYWSSTNNPFIPYAFVWYPSNGAFTGGGRVDTESEAQTRSVRCVR